MTPARILIADHTEFCHTIKLHLSANGFAVDTATDAASGIAALDAAPDLVLLSDHFSEQGEGQHLLDLCRERRLPVIVLTDEPETEREIFWLDAGADDILLAPVDPRLLIAHVKALLRRVSVAALPSHGDVIRFDNFEISQERFELKLSGKKVSIPPKELQLLYCLAASPNRVFSREQLLEHVWDFAFLGDSRTVDVHIKRLREKLSGVSQKWALKTVWGVGYKFEVYG